LLVLGAGEAVQRPLGRAVVDGVQVRLAGEGERWAAFGSAGASRKGVPGAWDGQSETGDGLLGGVFTGLFGEGDHVFHESGSGWAC
jgi:hypothetical protein